MFKRDEAVRFFNCIGQFKGYMTVNKYVYEEKYVNKYVNEEKYVNKYVYEEKYVSSLTHEEKLKLSGNKI